ncbi:TIGR03758 family integrating conjugative element protein [Pseudomonas serbiensis]|uniref:TIGR03758 family integrating conjugative element protein n=1 Tax=Pseudomonas serbiensis TaxID=3064350 RepID=A0ABT9CQI1_9PSED|nr:TIGR03758 family integrating conjugative element protein [Pseudomonas cichorii]MDO7927743.1 TIGR03758 family integrating conjugative element protein [Pseudomonas sp. KFB-138]
MTSDQSSAFQTAGGFSVAESSTLWIGVAVVLLTLWGVWTFQSIYRGWATQKLDRAAATGGVIRWTVLFMIMTFMLLH